MDHIHTMQTEITNTCDKIMHAINIEKPTTSVAKEFRGTMGAFTKPTYTEDEKNACTLDAMLNGGTCEPCK